MPMENHLGKLENFGLLIYRFYIYFIRVFIPVDFVYNFFVYNDFIDIDLAQSPYRNEFTIKDSFEAANRIQTIPNELFDEGYKFIKRHIFVY